jgi:hypothetical protein
MSVRRFVNVLVGFRLVAWFALGALCILAAIFLEVVW